MQLKELDLHVTNRCNYRCEVCCFTSNELALPELSTQELCDTIDAAVDLGCEAVHFTGGEPLLRNDIVQLVNHAVSKGLHCRLQTNGKLLSPSMAETLVYAGLTNVMFSIDSLDELTNRKQRAANSLPSVYQAIDVATQAGMDIRVNAVLTRLNVDDLVPLACSIAQRGVRKLSAFYFSPIGRGQRHMDWWLRPEEYVAVYEKIVSGLIQQKHDKNIPADMDVVLEKGYSTWEDARHLSLEGFTGCGAGCAHVLEARDYLIVRCDGNVYPCILSVGWERSLGNVREESLKDIWQHSVYWRQFNREVIKEYCGDCAHWLVCSGGCAGYSQVLANNHELVDPRCTPGKLVPLCPIMKYNVRNDRLGGSSEDVMDPPTGMVC